jgi:hypothetical protein
MPFPTKVQSLVLGQRATTGRKDRGREKVKTLPYGRIHWDLRQFSSTPSFYPIYLASLEQATHNPEI